MSESSEPKKETVRITLPPRPTVGEGGTPPVKKETVRINLPSRPSLGAAPATNPKKESTKLNNLAKPPGLTPPRPPAPPAAPSLAKPPGAPGAAAPGAPPAPAAPRPPVAPGAPTAPAAARPPGAPAAPRPPAAPAAVPVTPAATAATPSVGGTPKKDTVRIEVPAARQAPQATVKLQQTQPLVRPPAAEVRTMAAPAVINVDTDDVASAEDGSTRILAFAVLVLALVTFIFEALTTFTLK